MQEFCGHQLKKMFYPQVQLFVHAAAHGFRSRLQPLVFNGLGFSLPLFFRLGGVLVLPVNNFSGAAFFGC